MSNIELVVTALDGSLWDDDLHVSEDTKAALTWLDDAGIPVLAATARASRSAHKILNENSIRLTAAVLLNGALGIDCRNNTRFHSTTFTVQETRRVLRLFLNFGIEPCVYLESEDVFMATSKTPSSAPEYLTSVDADVAYVDDLSSFVGNRAVFGILAVGMSRATLKPVADALSDVTDVKLVPHPELDSWTLIVVPSKIDKWAAVKSFCNANNIATNRILSVGSHDNDLEILGAARIACAMANASLSAMNSAKVIIDNWSSILDFIERN